jgi:hypothetical protein
MLILSDLFWSTALEADTRLYADHVWSLLIHCKITSHHAVCWSSLILSAPVRTVLSYSSDFLSTTFSHIIFGPPGITLLLIFLSKIRKHCCFMRATCPDIHISYFDHPSDTINIPTVHWTKSSNLGALFSDTLSNSLVLYIQDTGLWSNPLKCLHKLQHSHNTHPLQCCRSPSCGPTKLLIAYERDNMKGRNNVVLKKWISRSWFQFLLCCWNIRGSFHGWNKSRALPNVAAVGTWRKINEA